MALKAATLLNRVCINIGVKTIFLTLGLSLAVVIVFNTPCRFVLL